MAQYISQSNMRKVNTWATEVEIQATADYLGVDIFTFNNGHWLKYSCTTKPLSTNGIYLENKNNVHYETVICVKTESNGCYGCCPIKNSSTGYNTRSKKVDAQTQNIVITNMANEKAKFVGQKSLSVYMKKKKLKHLQNIYKENQNKIKETKRRQYRQHGARKEMQREKYH